MKVPVPSRWLAVLLSLGLLVAGVWLANVANNANSSFLSKNWRFYMLKSLAYGLFLLAAMPWAIRRLSLSQGESYPLYLWVGIFLIVWVVVLFFAWL